MAKIPHLINTFVKIGQNVLTHRAFDGLIADYPIEVGPNYRKWKSGAFQQWGNYSGNSNGSDSLEVIFPFKFTGDPYVWSQPRWNSTWGYSITNHVETSTSFKFKPVNSWDGTQISGAVANHWFAEGRWK